MLFRLPAWRGLALVSSLIAAVSVAYADHALVGQRAPALVTETLNGGQVALDDLRGKPVLVHFWATWCGACVREMPEIERAQRELGDANLAVLAVDVGEERNKVAAHVAERGYRFRVTLDPDWKAAERYGIIGLPVSFLVDARGIVRARMDGGNLTREKIAELVQRLLMAPHDS